MRTRRCGAKFCLYLAAISGISGVLMGNGLSSFKTVFAAMTLFFQDRFRGNDLKKEDYVFLLDAGAFRKKCSDLGQ
ncbi:MAG TPA: hypothetical protein VK717_04605 [Opitutaceae bacterium]|jgi:hypothetical protein|nr:hypothetical protein [Opitutaceae bacterium]